MKPIFKFIILALITIINSFNSAAQSLDNYSSKIDSLLKTDYPNNFNGVILVTKKGKIKYEKSWGYSNIQKKTPLKLRNNFKIMSNTKQITSVLVLKEVEKGHLDLHTPIKKYLPELSQTWADSVTIHQLLNHTHGIIDIEKPLVFKPGSDFRYGNLSNILLGKIIESTTKKPYTVLANKLFKQLKMNNTRCYTDANKVNLVQGYIVKNKIFNAVDTTIITIENTPADGVISTAKDLAVWNGALHKGKILKPETYQKMTTESVKSLHKVFGKEKMGYGYNIRIAEQNGIKYFGHTGLGDGFASLNIYIPDTDVSIIVLENQMNDNSDLFYYFETKIKDIILNSNIVKQ